MALQVTYDPVLSRMRLVMTGANASATRVLFERSADALRYETVRGGYKDVNSGNAVLDDYEFEPGANLTYRAKAYDGDITYNIFGATISQDLERVWLKVPAVPFLNTPLTVVSVGDVSRRARAGVLEVRNRNFPVQVGDVRLMRQFELRILTDTAAEERDMHLRIGTGDVVFLHLPSTVTNVPGGYFSVGDVTSTPTMRTSSRRVWTLPLTEVAPPGPDVVGSAYTCASVLAEYTTVTEMLTENATVLALLSRTGTPSEVLVP